MHIGNYRQIPRSTPLNSGRINPLPESFLRWQKHTRYWGNVKIISLFKLESPFRCLSTALAAEESTAVAAVVLPHGQPELQRGKCAIKTQLLYKYLRCCMHVLLQPDWQHDRCRDRFCQLPPSWFWLAHANLCWIKIAAGKRTHQEREEHSLIVQ
jgi:hypothetical protein